MERENERESERERERKRVCEREKEREVCVCDKNKKMREEVRGIFELDGRYSLSAQSCSGIVSDGFKSHCASSCAPRAWRGSLPCLRLPAVLPLQSRARLLCCDTAEKEKKASGV